MNDTKLKKLMGVETLSKQLGDTVCVYQKTRAILNQTYSALGRIREYKITDTTASYPLKIIPDEQSTTKNIQIRSRLA